MWVHDQVEALLAGGLAEASSLRRLDLSRNRFDGRSATLLARAFATAAPPVGSGTATCAVRSSSPLSAALTELRLSDNPSLFAGGKFDTALRELLRGASALGCFDAANTGLEPTGWTALADALTSSSAHNDIAPTGSSNFAPPIRCLRLDLERNKLPLDSVLAAMAATLKQLPGRPPSRLASLNCDLFKFLGDKV